MQFTDEETHEGPQLPVPFFRSPAVGELSYDRYQLPERDENAFVIRLETCRYPGDMPADNPGNETSGCYIVLPRDGSAILEGLMCTDGVDKRLLDPWLLTSPENGKAHNSLVLGRCIGCRKKTLRRCKGCQLSRFCSRECQKEAWNDGHKSFCKKMQKWKSDWEVSRPT